MTPGSRSIVHTIVCSSGVELFRSAGVTAAPVERPLVLDRDLELQELACSIDFTGVGLTGTLTLTLPVRVFGLVRQDPRRPCEGPDWVREGANQLLGRIKARLIPYELVLKVGLPSTPSRDSLRRMHACGALFALYPFRTLRGEVHVALGGNIEHAALVYVGGVPTAREGEIIEF